MSNLRYIASRIIHDVTEGHSLSNSLETTLSTIKDARDKSLVQAMCYGVCRFYMRLDAILSHLLEKPMKAKDSDVHALLLVGLYQLMEMRIPDYAAVAETVNATEKLKKSWARGFVNAVLREYLRERESLAEAIKSDEEAFYAHPEWWIQAIKTAWPNQWQEILQESNLHPPFALRVNQQHLTPEQYLEKLKAKDYSAQIIPETQYGIILDSPVTVEELPGFSAGEISVQDGAAQLAAELLELKSGLRVLDACAAPGGKLMHMLEMVPDLSVLAIEKDRTRMPSIQENLSRLNVTADCICQDANKVSTWWDGNLFDRILLDAPCSASGVVRRHPDIKLLRYPSDIQSFAKEQLQLLTSLWPTLKPDGLFLYVTCSVFPEENVQVLQNFMSHHSDAKEQKITADWGIECTVGRQILPGMHHMDGFYYALLSKDG